MDYTSGAKGNTCSAYGVTTYSPEEAKNSWRQSIERERWLRKKHPTAETEQEAIQNSTNGSNMSYFNNGKKHVTESPYDRTFHIKHGFHSKLKRDDREHTLGLNVHSEEQSKAVPILSSSAYGHRPSLEMPSRKHVRVALIQRDFYRDCGTNIPSSADDCPHH